MTGIAHVWRRGFRAMLARAYPRIVGTGREKSWVVYHTALPLLGTIAFAYAYKSLGASARFTGYVIMAGATAALWTNVMWGVASQFYWDKKRGNLELYMTVPCGIGPILLGMSVGGLLPTLLRAVLIVWLGAALFPVSVSLAQLPLFLLVFSVAIIGLYGLGVMCASLFLLWGREAWHTTNLFTEPVYLLSGLYFPVRALGFWTATTASIIPLTLSLDAMRQLLFGKAHPAFLSVDVELAILCGLAAAFLFMARVMLRKMELLARREGRLSLRF